MSVMPTGIEEFQKDIYKLLTIVTSKVGFQKNVLSKADIFESKTEY